MSDLQSAIDFLGAVEVAPGRYAFQEQTGDEKWFVADAQTLRAVAGDEQELIAVSLGAPQRDQKAEANRSQWHLVEMAAWWAPEGRFAWRVVDETGGPLTTGFKKKDNAEAERQHHRGERVERITADLETGEEIAA